jgi:HlyD family secretion protein
MSEDLHDESEPRSTWSKFGAPAWSFVTRRKLWFAIGAAIVLVLAFVFLRPKSDTTDYRTAEVDRGAITRVVSATGTLEPLVSANVGSTVSGPVTEVLVDYNSQVQVGQVLARLDPSSFQQRVTQALATLSQAQANLAVAEADYQRYAELQRRGFASEQLMAQQRAARDTARASVQSAQAALASARTDLGRSVITSPIAGVVVDRQVNVGQSVAASLQAPTLFIIAQDLSQLQANITVDEADIGEVREGQAVRFTVDAFPDRNFEGVVAQVRQQGAAEQGVVTYTVVVRADNPDRRLLPGMTANAEIILEEQTDVLRLPNTALRFRPADDRIAARGQALVAETRGGGAGPVQAGAATQGGGQGRGQGGRMLEQLTESLQLTPEQQATARDAARNALAANAPGEGASQSERRAFMRRVRAAVMSELEPTLSDTQRQALAQLRERGERRDVRQQAIVWVLRNNQVEPVAVEIGVADNSHTLLYSGLEAGDLVIVGGGPPGAGGASGARPGGGVRIRGV